MSAEIRIASPEYTIGSTLQLECIVRGSQADVAWFFNSDVPLVTDYRHYRILPNNTLIIYSLSASDSGEYKCIAQNQQNSASASVPIKVESNSFIFYIKIYFLYQNLFLIQLFTFYYFQALMSHQTAMTVPILQIVTS